MSPANPSAPVRTLTRLSLLALTLALLAPALHAQWKTETYPLRGGWNAIYLHGDASHTTPAQLFEHFPTVLKVWRWNPNPDRATFDADPSQTTAEANEWTIWDREDRDEQRLTAMIGQSAYLIYCSGPSSSVTNVMIPQRPLPPAATWLVTGANLMGFPAGTANPTFTNYFATFPTPVAAPSKVFRYTGGELSRTNPIAIAPATERIDRNTAYWFEAATVSNFTAPVEYELPSTNGLAFGRSHSVLTIGVMNRSTSAVTLSFALQNSENAPVGQSPISGPTPLAHRVFNAETNAYTETPMTSGFTLTIPASGRTDVSFTLDRDQLGTDSSALFASLLRVRDTANFTDVYLPVSAQVASPAGLWLGEVLVDSVTSTVAGSPGSTTSRGFPLRFIVHVDTHNVARLLSQAYVGTLASAGNLPGVTSRLENLHPPALDTAMRLISSTMPLDREIIPDSGTFAVGATLVHRFEIPFNDPTNPFVHQYHPDHDNRDARGNPLPAGVESYHIVRTCEFTFTRTPPTGSAVSGWGTTAYGGTYAETIEGLNKRPLTVGGTFVFRRISEIAEFTQ